MAGAKRMSATERAFRYAERIRLCLEFGRAPASDSKELAIAWLAGYRSSEFEHRMREEMRSYQKIKHRAERNRDGRQ